MILQVYSDESYRLESGQKVISVGGWLSKPGKFKQFCPLWRSALKKYGVSYFHFSEFSGRRGDYKGWDNERREDFLFDLALVACNAAIPIGGNSTPSGNKEPDEAVIRRAFNYFFESVLRAVEARFDPDDDIVEFLPDENDDPKWRNALDTCLKAFKDNGTPFGNSSPKDDKVFLPLQAADLYVYAMRQNAERFFAGGQNPGQARLLDFILEKNRPDLENWKISPLDWDHIVRRTIKHSRQWRKLNPDKKYYPWVHYPLIYRR